MDGNPRARWPRAVGVSLAVVVVAAAAFVVLALGNHNRHSVADPQRTTLEAALAAFGGQTDLFLKLDPVTGDSTNAHHPKEIDIATLSWGLTNATTSPSGATLSAVTLTKGIDSASPKLFIASAKGTAYTTAKISADRTGVQSATFATLTLGAVKIASFRQVSDRTNGFTETIALKFSKATLSFKPQNADGSLGTAVTGCWNLVTKTTC
jgi:type VI secretion system secreted protein Hcp